MAYQTTTTMATDGSTEESGFFSRRNQKPSDRLPDSAIQWTQTASPTGLSRRGLEADRTPPFSHTPSWPGVEYVS
jgi:hypothetical protein